MSEVIPLEKSAAACNGKYVYCQKYGYRRKYFICLNTIAAIKRGNIKPGTPSEECQRACNSGSCSAQEWREEETKAGSAIHYVEDPYRQQLKDREEKANRPVTPKKTWRAAVSSVKQNVSKPTPSYDVSSKSPVTKPSAPKPKPEKKFAEMDLATVVTDMAKEETVKKAAVPKKEKDKPLPGESMLDMAKRLMKERSKK